MDHIQILFLILFFCLLFAVLLFTQKMQLRLNIGTSSLLSLTARWLDPFLKVIFHTEDTVPLLSVFLFGIRIYNKTPKNGKKRSGNKKLYQSAALEDIRVNATYSLGTPYSTGLASGIASALSSFLPGELHLSPDFMAESDYLEVDATAKLSLGKTLVHLMK